VNAANQGHGLLADRLRTLGYSHATEAGISICIEDMVIPTPRRQHPRQGHGEVREIETSTEGLITDGERYNKVVDIWVPRAETGRQEMMVGIGKEEVVDDGNEVETRMPSFNPIFMMADSGARGSARPRFASWPACAA
jgi:DNA-directed RNA polymerase subunit beta'